MHDNLVQIKDDLIEFAKENTVGKFETFKEEHPILAIPIGIVSVVAGVIAAEEYVLPWIDEDLNPILGNLFGAGLNKFSISLPTQVFDFPQPGGVSSVTVEISGTVNIYPGSPPAIGGSGSIEIRH